MGLQKQSKKLLRTIISLIKDKTSLLLATPHSLSSRRLASLTDRLRRTSSCHVALKCLIVIHHGQLYFDAGGRNFLNLSNFRDKRDIERWELSNWVRFYSCYLEANLIASRKLGVFISGSNPISANLSNLSSWEVMREIEVLVGVIEEICKAPISGFGQKTSLVHEILRLTSEDYGHIQRLVASRLSEFRGRVAELEKAELAEIAGFLRRVEGCRERMTEVFGNKKRNDAFWVFVREIMGELTRFVGRVGNPSEWVTESRLLCDRR